MNKIKRIASMLLFASAHLLATAQEAFSPEIRFLNTKAEKSNNNLVVSTIIDLSALHLDKNSRIRIIPEMVPLRDNTPRTLPYILIEGDTRHKVTRREQLFGNHGTLEKNAFLIEHRKNGTSQTLAYTATIPLSDALKKGTLRARVYLTGCADCPMAEALIPMLSVNMEDYVPTYTLTYNVPQAEPVKARNEKYAARFNYKVGRHELLRDFKDNAREFDRIDRIINQVKGDKNLTITQLTIDGYASPEGSFAANRTLSQRRADAFADYLVKQHALNRSMFRVNWHGEDWKGLEEAVRQSSMADKEQVLQVINSLSDPDARKARLKKIAGGATYAHMLQTLYPPLRRNEYTIAYVARAFDVEEAKEIIKTKPQLLSLNEMYLVAKTYPTNSDEFKEVFDIAARLFPDQPVAIINSAAADIEGGNHAAAIARLKKIENNPVAWNNLGVAYARQGDSKNAMRFFQMAAKKQQPDALKNLEELKKALADKQ